MTQESPEKIICPHCGKEIYDPDALLCLFCGESLHRSSSGILGMMYGADRKAGWKTIWTVGIVLLIAAAFMMAML